MSKRDDALEIINSLGFPRQQRNQRSSLTLLALAALKERMDFTAFKKYASDIVWESEVWIADFPDHMIHFNGDKFIGPYPHRTDEKRQ